MEEARQQENDKMNAAGVASKRVPRLVEGRRSARRVWELIYDSARCSVFEGGKRAGEIR